MITKFNLKDKTIKSYAIRKLTPFECFRLMGVRDGVIHVMQSTIKKMRNVLNSVTGKKEPQEVEEMAVSASQQYKQAGNSIVVDVLKYIYEQLWYPKGYDKPKRGYQMTIFDVLGNEDGDELPDYPVDKSTGVKHILTTFSGYDSQLMAADALKEEHPEFKWDCVGWSDIDKYACQMHDLVFPQYADQALGDITKIDWHKVKEDMNGADVDLFTYSSPCFVAGTLVLTDKGFKNIEDIRIGDYVLTHSNEYKKVVEFGAKRSTNIIKVKGQSIHEILCTTNHPFYVREMYRYGHKSIRAFKEPEWKAARDLTTKDYLGIAINTKSEMPKWDGVILNYGGRSSYRVNNISKWMHEGDFWYLMGRYVGDGWTRCDKLHKQVVIAFSGRNELSMLSCLSKLGINATITKERTCKKCVINSKELMEFVDRYGHGAINKRVDGETLNLSPELLSSFLRGYVDSDGCYDSKLDEYKVSTISKELTYGIQQVVAKVYHRPSRLYCHKVNPTCVIEGREVNQHDSYQLAWHTDNRKQDKSFYEDGYIWTPCKGFESTYLDTLVYNMEVEDDHSYTANGIIVHNCQDISQAGKQMGLKEGSGSRSALLWNVADAIEVLKPKYLLQENVAALISKKFMPDFQLWLDRLESLGYVNFWAKLNAKNYGVPQNRDRVFCISMRKDVAFKYKFPEPFELKKKLEDILEEEVEEKYFLKDDAVGKFLKANDKDDAVFVQFGMSPSHENAMFLKTWYTMAMDTLKVWEMSATELEAKVTELQDKFFASFNHWQETGEMPGEEFRKMFEENMKPKSAEV